ncbi:hypothetical protein D1O33_00475 [Rhodococcus rhodochrous]|uniref:hypothetical protein n=1 Tax=Rhodococcus rhodochrous TaxID=1829 RepID=UPI00132F10EB|nr:hypothetical protein [Rhodococcus rhodochrous]QHG80577.1 hypothetical protein D1O33_00475 [Rhodococcus rhodochrous]
MIAMPNIREARADSVPENKTVRAIAGNPALTAAVETLPDYPRFRDLLAEAKKRRVTALKARQDAEDANDSFYKSLTVASELPQSLAAAYSNFQTALENAVSELRLVSALANHAASSIESLVSIHVDDLFAALNSELDALTKTVLRHAENIPAPYDAEAALSTREAQEAYCAIRDLLPTFRQIRAAQETLVRDHTYMHPEPYQVGTPGLHTLALVRNGISAQVHTINAPAALVTHAQQGAWVPTTEELEQVWTTENRLKIAEATKVKTVDLMTYAREYRYA